MKIYTIGFTKTNAENFFRRLEQSKVRSVLDTRLNRTSQLSGFAKQDDLRFFLQRISNVVYKIEESLAPTSDMLDAYRRKEVSWREYEKLYLDLLNDRKVENIVDIESMEQCCLLCSEAKPDHCHRRLAANYMADAKEGISIIHL